MQLVEFEGGIFNPVEKAALAEILKHGGSQRVEQINASLKNSSNTVVYYDDEPQQIPPTSDRFILVSKEVGTTWGMREQAEKIRTYIGLPAASDKQDIENWLANQLAAQKQSKHVQPKPPAGSKPAAPVGHKPIDAFAKLADVAVQQICLENFSTKDATTLATAAKAIKDEKVKATAVALAVISEVFSKTPTDSNNMDKLEELSVAYENFLKATAQPGNDIDRQKFLPIVNKIIAINHAASLAASVDAIKNSSDLASAAQALKALWVDQDSTYGKPMHAIIKALDELSSNNGELEQVKAAIKELGEVIASQGHPTNTGIANDMFTAIKGVHDKANKVNMAMDFVERSSKLLNTTPNTPDIKRYHAESLDKLKSYAELHTVASNLSRAIDILKNGAPTSVDDIKNQQDIFNLELARFQKQLLIGLSPEQARTIETELAALRLSADEVTKTRLADTQTQIDDMLNQLSNAAAELILSANNGEDTDTVNAHTSTIKDLVDKIEKLSRSVHADASDLDTAITWLIKNQNNINLAYATVIARRLKEQAPNATQLEKLVNYFETKLTENHNNATEEFQSALVALNNLSAENESRPPLNLPMQSIITSVEELKNLEANNSEKLSALNKEIIDKCETLLQTIGDVNQEINTDNTEEINTLIAQLQQKLSNISNMTTPAWVREFANICNFALSNKDASRLIDATTQLSRDFTRDSTLKNQAKRLAMAIENLINNPTKANQITAQNLMASLLDAIPENDTLSKDNMQAVKSALDAFEVLTETHVAFKTAALNLLSNNNPSKWAEKIATLKEEQGKLGDTIKTAGSELVDAIKQLKDDPSATNLKSVAAKLASFKNEPATDLDNNLDGALQAAVETSMPRPKQQRDNLTAAFVAAIGATTADGLNVKLSALNSQINMLGEPLKTPANALSAAIREFKLGNTSTKDAATTALDVFYAQLPNAYAAAKTEDLDTVKATITSILDTAPKLTTAKAKSTASDTHRDRHEKYMNELIAIKNAIDEQIEAKIQEDKYFITSRNREKWGLGDYKKLKDSMEKRIRLLDSMWENKQVREKVTDRSIFTAFTPSELRDKFDFLTGKNSIKAHPLDKFTTLCEKAFDNIHDERHVMGVHFKTAAEVFSFNAGDKKDEEQMRIDANGFFPTAGSISTSETSLGQLSTKKNRPNPVGDRIHEADSSKFTAYKLTGEHGDIAFAQRLDPYGVGVSSVMNLPSELNPEHIWAQHSDMFRNMLRSLPNIKATDKQINEIFDSLFKQILDHQGKYGSMSTFQDSLKIALAQSGIQDDKFVKEFFAQYETAYSTALKNPKNGLPCDDLLNLALNQIDALKQKHPHDPIVINSANSEEQVKAWMLAARIRGYRQEQIINNSDFKGVTLRESIFSNDVKKCREYLLENEVRFAFKDHMYASKAAQTVIDKNTPRP